MRIATIVNPNAGQVSADVVVQKIKKSLFRCELDFFLEKSLTRLADFIEDQVLMEADAIVLVGGDGTINCVANIAMKLKGKGLQIPPICLVSQGTANDLAYELGVDIRIDRAVQAIFSGKAEPVDLLKITSGTKESFMFTNGGVGLTAETAKSVNALRSRVSDLASPTSMFKTRTSQVLQSGLRQLGPNIYNAMLAKKWIGWDKCAEVEITIDDEASFKTNSPFVLINNQKTLARRFHTAPATKNNDGKFNILVLNQQSSFQQFRNVAKIGSGRWIQSSNLISKEVSSVVIRSLTPSKPLTFLGDGEILHDDVDSVSISCVHPGLEMISDRKGQS